MRTVLVTGGGKGIGRAVVERFTAAGERVIAVGRDRAALEATGAESAECDVTDEAAVSALFDRIGALDVLVINAGAASSAPLAKTSLHDWNALHDVNATGAFLCTRAALPRLNEHGRIVTVASVNGRIGARYTSAYTASKHAAVGLARVTAAELAGSTKTANAVCPGYVRTPMTERTIATIERRTGKDGEAELAKLSPLNRLLEPEEVAFAVAFLAAPEAGAINGQTLVLDGGGIQT
ncbi:SDR family NAD(P)-dependent oxidoreductase [Candidatus Solirubrobacter pratensis]|uniref:SDR family NAD(P)-dependent oxidoreductase n=1 Tax=Candidatus Solirubrobacter pratensis TaxID=1298857 RepID=UPI00041EEE5B|nr:SDR family NAD(P)-dependent oxidoreductase [Candidatus Solirubrobacter pratensis]